MSLEVFQVCLHGYTDRLLDQQILGVQQGYWAGYYSRAKKPKSVQSVVQKLVRTKIKEHKSSKIEKPEVDVQAFRDMEEKFQKRMQQLNK